MKILTIFASLAAAYFGLASASPLKRPGCRKYVVDCESHHKVVASDTCAILATEYNITISYLLDMNPGMSCSALPVGKNICHKARSISCATTTGATYTPTPTTTTTATATATGCSLYHTVVSSDGPAWCLTIAKNAGISLSTFYALNPTIDNPSCDNIDLGEKVCIKGGNSTTTADNIAVVQDVDNFCFFLPPPGSNKNIADHETDAVAFCTSPNALSPNALAFPDGFFTYKYYLAGKKVGNYVQITGQIDDSKYGLKTSDGGGQYDSEGSPPNATCAGYAHFVNLIEPDVHRFCIRCCQVRSDCNFDHSKDGCPTVVPGNYGPGEAAIALDHEHIHV